MTVSLLAAVLQGTVQPAGKFLIIVGLLCFAHILRSIGEANRKLEQAAEKATEEATEEAIEKLIHTCKSFGIDKYLVAEKLVVEYKLSKADATSKVEQYWNDNN